MCKAYTLHACPAWEGRVPGVSWILLAPFLLQWHPWLVYDGFEVLHRGSRIRLPGVESWPCHRLRDPELVVDSLGLGFHVHETRVIMISVVCGVWGLNEKVCEALSRGPGTLQVLHERASYSFKSLFLKSFLMSFFWFHNPSQDKWCNTWELESESKSRHRFQGNKSETLLLPTQQSMRESSNREVRMQFGILIHCFSFFYLFKWLHEKYKYIY